jgi:2,3-bisphosphoglycerate-dependent phosphoglycerate mutase
VAPAQFRQPTAGDAAQEFGEKQVVEWRRSYSGRPPALPPDDQRHPRFAACYAHLTQEELPASESLKGMLERILPTGTRRSLLH